jgi:hypothetical protein
MTVSKKKLGYSLGIIGIILSVFAYFSANYIQNITISNSTIQSQIDKKLPFTKEKLGIKVVINQAKTTITDNVTLDLNGIGSIFEKTIPFSAHVVGTVNYKNGSFYFNPNDIVIDYGKAETNITESPIASKIIDSSIKKSKELGINNDDFKNFVTNTIKNKMETIPVYTLKSSVIKASLKDVKLKDGNIYINMSVFELAKTVLIFLVSGILIIIISLGLITYGDILTIGIISFI